MDYKSFINKTDRNVLAHNLNGNSKLKIPNNFTGIFSLIAINGQTEVKCNKECRDLHFKTNLSHFKYGYKGENENNENKLRASTFNGNSILEFN